MTDGQLSRLNSATVSDICVSQKLCKPNETPLAVDGALGAGAPLPAVDEDGEPLETIPDIEGAADAHASSDPKGFKQYNKAQDAILRVYA